MRLRLARESDIAQINEIEAWAILHTSAHFALDPEPPDRTLDAFRDARSHYPWLVAADDAATPAPNVLGYARASPWKTRQAYRWTAELTVYVRPEHHARGIGRSLYAALLDTLRAQGYRMVLGGITLPNPASVALHERLGMTCLGVLPRVGFKFGRWHDVGYWGMDLAPGAADPGQVLPVLAAADPALA
jgi:L-amino acid N-acyltransferase YncA